MEFAPKKTVVDLMDKAVERFSHHSALGLPGKKVSYHELGALIDRTAAGLQELGVTRGTPVGLSFPNSLHGIAAYFGVLKAGGVAVNFNPQTPSSELAPKVRDSGISIMMMVDHKRLNAQVAPLLDTTCLKQIIVCPLKDSLTPAKRLLYPWVAAFTPDPNDRRYMTFAELSSGRSVPTKVGLAADDVAEIVYTSGTTGEPKGVERTHGAVCANVHQTKLWLPGLNSGCEQALGFIPAFHVYGKNLLLATMDIGGSYFPIAIPDFKQIVHNIRKNKISVLAVLPDTYRRMNDWMEKDPDSSIKSLKYCISGGEALPADVAREFRERTGLRILNGYGSTEGGPFMGGMQPEGDSEALFPAAGSEFQVVDKHGNAVTPGENGEVLFRGPQVMKGYLGKPEATRTKMPNASSILTGDTGRLNANGSLVLTGRTSNMIIVNGNNVYPGEVEAAIALHPEIRECAVIKGFDAQKGLEQVHAIVVLQRGAKSTPAEIRQFLADELLPYKIPTDIKLQKEPLPRNPVGKIEYVKLAPMDNAIGPRQDQANRASYTST